MGELQTLTVILVFTELMGKVMLADREGCLGPRSNSCEHNHYYNLYIRDTLTIKTPDNSVFGGTWQSEISVRQLGSSGVCIKCFLTVTVECSPQPFPASIQLSQGNYTGEAFITHTVYKPMASYGHNNMDYPQTLNTSGTSLKISFTNTKGFNGHVQITVVPYVPDTPPASLEVVIVVIIMVTVVTALISAVVICSLKLLRKRAARNSVRMVPLVNES